MDIWVLINKLDELLNLFGKYLIRVAEFSLHCTNVGNPLCALFINRKVHAPETPPQMVGCIKRESPLVFE